MRHFATLPSPARKGTHQWDTPVGPAVKRFIDGLQFAPVEAQVWVSTGIFAAADLLGLKVPWQMEEGTVEVEPGYVMVYTWGSVDGRATEWLRLDGPAHRDPLQRLMERLGDALQPKSLADLQLILRGAVAPA